MTESGLKRRQSGLNITGPSKDVGDLIVEIGNLGLEPGQLIVLGVIEHSIS